MARKIQPDETFETLRDEVDFTVARLEDEPLAAALVARTAEWQTRSDATEQTARAVQREATRVDAARQGGNEALDNASTHFGDNLLSAVNKDRTSARWRGFYRTTVSDFNRKPLGEQAAAVRGWLTDSQDPVLLAEKEPLETATVRVERATVRENALASRRGDLWQAREALAAFLTMERDTLHDDLSAIARSQKLPRSWPSSFFRTGDTPPKKPTPVVPPG